ncbi:hypothetical protein OS121_29760 [Mycolicibacterium mucogenicum]|uniref:hypothetical protein n=1 Tax=Mycolicibacterium mucogenicum TaxID=56689 RepID=UPI002269C178|nr:hypothetical protein [Mycolicibacterium mucogenicum]MCX8559236.1 hypothetical protein [Mycolicibacterium mucogenicum]
MEHVIITGGRAYRVTCDDDDDAGADTNAYLEWLVESRGEAVTLGALSRQQVLARIGRSALPPGFPAPDVVVGDPDATGFVRGWLPTTVDTWLAAQIAEPAVVAPDDQDQPPGESAPDDRTTEADAPADAGAWVRGNRLWSESAAVGAEQNVLILGSRGAVTPSGLVLTRGPLQQGADLASLVWYRWKVAPAAAGRGRLAPVPQIWITAQALLAVGMQPPEAPSDDDVELTSDDLKFMVADLFGCEVTSGKAGWFTCRFAAPDGTQSRVVQLILLPFLWMDSSPQRPNDQGLAGEADTPTELPADEDAAIAELGRRLIWHSTITQATEPALLPAPRPATVGAALLDTVRARSRSKQFWTPGPLPATVISETPVLDPNLSPSSLKNRAHKAVGDATEVEVDQRAAYLASAGQVDLGHGEPEERRNIDPELLADKAPFGLWRVTTPPAGELDGLSRRLPLPHGYMDWDEARTFWTTSRALRHLMDPVEIGGAGLTVVELQIDAAWIWPHQGRLLRTWADTIKVQLDAAIAAGDAFEINYLKNVYKATIGRMASDQHPKHQRHYQQVAWAATIRADTRARALRYAATVASERGWYPIEAGEIDALIYRLPADVDPDVLNEASQANGKYRVKKVLRRDGGD